MLGWEVGHTVGPILWGWELAVTVHPPALMPGWVVSLFVGFAHGAIMTSKLLVLDGIHGS